MEIVSLKTLMSSRSVDNFRDNHSCPICYRSIELASYDYQCHGRPAARLTVRVTLLTRDVTLSLKNNSMSKHESRCLTKQHNLFRIKLKLADY